MGNLIKENEKPRLSIIVPVYKSEKYLHRCVESILNQSFTDFELILVDDGSPDSCPAICDSYSEIDHRVHTLHKKNGGVSKARNSGIEISKGDFITFVDSDDYISLSMYQEMFDIIDTYKCDVAMCDCYKVYEKSKRVYSHDIRGGYYDKDSLLKEYYPHLLIMENVEYPPTISNWLIVFRRDMFLDGKIPKYIENVRFSEDLLFGAEVLYSANSFYYMKGKCLYYYCMNEASASHTYVNNKWDDYTLLIKGLWNKFSKSTKYDFTRQLYLVELFLVYNAVGEIIRSKQLSEHERLIRSSQILKSSTVREMFRNINISKLQVPNKLKIVTLIYKYRIGLRLLIRRYS